jgi:CBS domain-containing protein
VRQLARVLTDGEIGGAPVVDAEGTLLGVVSATDVVRLAADDADVHVTASTLPPDRADVRDPLSDEALDPDPFGYFLPEDSPFAGERLLELFTESELDELEVADIMTPVTFSVGPDETVQELADFLVRGRIHRAVVQQEGVLLGIVTTWDVLKAVATGRLKQ